MKTRLARPADVEEICRLIRSFAEEGLLLPRTNEQVRKQIGNFIVLMGDVSSVAPAGTPSERPPILGCVAVEPYGRDLAEIRSLAVDSEAHGNGLGGRLVESALALARRRKIARVFAVTHAAPFFERHGFIATSRHELPEKIARDCAVCPKAHNCNLVALVAVVCPDRVLLPVLARAGDIPVPV